VNPELISNILSLGLAYVSTTYTDASGLTDQVPGYDLFVQGYLNLPHESLFLRPALRMSFEPPAVAERPKAISISEKNYKSALEIGLLFNGPLVPVITVQGALVRRSLELKTNDRIGSDSKHDMNRTEYLWQSGITLGLGLPMMGGDIVVEPFYRFVKIGTDERQDQQWGLDLSYVLTPFKK
jgi:hypothetical protein